MTATATSRTRTRKSSKIEYKSKSAEALALMTGKDPEHLGVHLSVSAVEKLMIARGRPMNYAFIYGVAKRNKINLTAANRRPVRKITTNGDNVVVQTASGSVTVNTANGIVTAGKFTLNISAGTVTRSRSRR